jgi:hypothetical protein
MPVRPFGLEFGGESGLFGFEVGFNVAMCGFDALVTEPERDHSDIDPGLKQVHGRCVPHEVGVTRLAAKSGQVADRRV